MAGWAYTGEPELARLRAKTMTWELWEVPWTIGIDSVLLYMLNDECARATGWGSEVRLHLLHLAVSALLACAS